MLPVHLFLVGGVMLSCSPASSLDSGKSGSLHLERCETARFLAELRSVPGHQCLRDRTDFPCPWKEGTNITPMTLGETTSCYSQSLRQVLHLFDTEASRAAWHERALDQLLSSLWRELQVLKRPREQGQSCPLPFALAIRTYFRGFFRYLKAKAHSACSWEIVRVQLSWARSTRPARTTLQQDPSAHVYWESLIAEAKRLRAQNLCCFYRPRRGVSHTRIGYPLSLICMFLI